MMQRPSHGARRPAQHDQRESQKLIQRIGIDGSLEERVTAKEHVGDDTSVIAIANPQYPRT
jgi:hypothetical protein